MSHVMCHFFLGGQGGAFAKKVNIFTNLPIFGVKPGIFMTKQNLFRKLLLNMGLIQLYLGQIQSYLEKYRFIWATLEEFRKKYSHLKRIQ